MKKVLAIFVVVVCLLIINNLIHSIYNLWQKRDLVTLAQEELNKAKEENTRLKSRLSLVDSPQFIEEEARNKLFLVKPGEEILITKGLSSASSSAQSNKNEKSNWQRWWELFF